jgi:hypothetical protein
MNKNYVFKNSKSLSQGLPAFMKCYSKICCLIVALFSVASLNAQTTIINPATDGGFNLGSTFAANGWTVANQGTSSVKWAVGSAASGTTSVGSVTSASASVTLTASNPSITVGQIVYGSGIPANTFVSAIAGTALTLSQPATLSAATVTLGFGKSSGGISVGTTQVTSATAITAGSFTITLLAANPNISVGMLITSNAFIGANTYVASINGTALGLSNPTTASAAGSQNLIFSATSSAISGNAAYVSNDNGASNSYAGYPTTRTVYFYKDITTIPANETAMTLTFDVKSAPASGGGWQVFVAPTSQTVTGTDTQVTLPFNYGVSWPGATLISFNSNPQVATTKTTAFIPKSFAGTSFRLIFVWTNGTGAGTLSPAAIDNISLVSRIPEEITSAQSGLWSQSSTWDGGKVPTHADTVVLDSNAESVIIDSRYSGCEDLILLETNTLVQFAISTVVDEFTVYNDLNIAGSGARFNNHDGTNGKHLKLGHNLDVGVGARFDSNFGSGAFQGRLTLNGTTVQNITVDPAGFLGGSLIQPQGAVSTGANQIGVLNQLEVNNSATAASNVVWNVPVTRIKSNLIFTNARVNVTTGNRFVIGNFSNLGQGSLVCNTGSGFTNGLVSKWLLSGDTYTVNPGTQYPGLHNNNNPYRFPFISPSGADRTFYVLPDGNASLAGEIAVLYTDATTVTSGLSIPDGSYSISNRFNGNYTISTPESSATTTSRVFTPNATTTTFRIGAYLNGAFEALDGSARFMNQTAALAGTHQDGTNTPFVFRRGLSLAQLTAAPIYVGIKSSSIVDTSTAIVSAGSGDWNTAATWVGGVVPGCTNSVSIASGHTVTVTSTANAANLLIATGGTLVNNSAANNMTVGCTNNNAAFNNNGTHTMTSGKLFVNGAVAHKAGSFFNQTGGEVIVDSNNNGDVATSVAFGGTSFKLETSNLNLTNGKITIVDPLVNIETPISATSIENYSLTTEGAAGVFVKATTNLLTTNSFTTSNSGGNLIAVGQVVTGHPNIPAGTTVLSTSLNFAGTINTVTLSQNVAGNVPSGTNLNFSSMLNGNTSIVLQNAPGNANLAVGQVVSGNGIQAGTTIASIANEFSAPTRSRIVLSLPVSGLATSPITAPETLSFSAVNAGSPITVLTAANPSIQIGMPVSGAGIKPGTIVANISGAVLTLSEPVQSGAPNPLVMSFYTFLTQSSGSFIYASPNHYATGLNHTLQIGDGVSTQNTSIVTNGFNCQFQAGGGLLSLGNLTVDAPNGAERFMNVSSNNVNSGTVPAGYNFNVQNNFTITAGSVFNKVLGNAPVYVGGNIVNNGTLNMPRGGNLYLGNIINGALVPSAIPQTISGSGTYLANLYNLNGSNLYNAHSVGSLTVNNTSAAGVTIGVPNFRVNGVSLTNGIVHTTATNTIYCGAPDVLNTAQTNGTIGFSPTVVGSATCHINGPIVHANKADANNTQNRLFPVGKNGKYLPISIASTGGVELMVEAFDTNTGTTSANASGLSANRWKVTRVGTLGDFTGYNVRLGSLTTPVTDSNLIVHAATENGVYDIVSSPISTMTYDAAHFSIPNLPTIALTTAQTGGLLGNFSYSNGAGCSGTPAPTAVASTTTLCLGQPTTLSLTGLTGADFTYQWQMNSGSGFENIALATNATYVANPTANTSYQCIVTCSSVSGTSNAVAITVSQSTAVTTGVTICEAGVANLAATGGSTLNWYSAATGGSLLTTGTTYAPTVASTTTYYVASASTSAGSVNTGVWAGTTATGALFKGIAFDVTNQTKLKTVTVYPKNTASRTPITISLFDSTGNIVTGTTPVTFMPTLNTGTLGTVSQVVTLDYIIPIGTGYRLVASDGLVATTNTLGNSTAAIVYPTIGAIRLLGNVSALNDVILTAANTTNCFHNLTFDETCESVTRTPVTATVGSNTTSTETITACDTYTWASNGTTYTASGTYTNVTTNASGCVDTATLELTINSSSSSTLDITSFTPYTWSENGTTYSASGTYTNVTTNAAGCPNTATLNLTISVGTFTTQVISPTCGSTLANIYSSVFANINGAATGYRFRVVGGTAGTQTIDRGIYHWFKLTQLPSYDYGTTYTVDVMLQIAGVWTGYYGASCTVTTPGLITPTLGSAVVSSPTCGSVLANIYTSIFTTPKSGATGYRYRVIRSGGETQVLDRTQHFFNLTQLPVYVYGATYTVEVAFKTTGDYTPYGATCTLSSPAVPSIVQCGLSRPASSTISVPALSSVTNYAFEVTNVTAATEPVVINRSVQWMPVSLIAGYSASNQYSVRVALTTSGVQSDFGLDCTINSAPVARLVDTTSTSELKVQGFPNPFTNNFTLEITKASEDKVAVMVYDMIGKLLDRVEVNATDNTLELGANYPAGVYNVIVSQGEKVETVRMIKR